MSRSGISSPDELLYFSSNYSANGTSGMRDTCISLNDDRQIRLHTFHSDYH